MEYTVSPEQGWMVKTDGLFTSGIREYLVNDGIPEEGTSSIIFNAARTLGYCPCPHVDENDQKTGLIIGKVQSGKTSNFIALTALAFDNDYDIVVVLGGTKKTLVKQNSDRIRDYFHSMEDVVNVLDTNENIDLIDEQRIAQFIRMRRKIIIVSLKSKAKINIVKEKLFNNTSLCDKPVLIIDDEGDEASLNTLVKKGRKSPTYRAIELLKESLRRHCYVSVTATPQANLLIEAIDVLSPDFGLLVDPGSGYCGLDVFHGADGRYTIPISQNEPSLLDDVIPKSFRDALSLFFVGCGIRKYRGMRNDEKHSMLIHPSQLKTDHSKVHAKVDVLLNKWEYLANNSDDISYKSFRDQDLKSAYNHYSQTIELPPFEVIEPDVLDAIRCCGRHLVNGDSIPNNADRFYPYNIYVGGNLLGRGLTLKGLAVTYIIRTARGVSTVDTVQQRARWFGYKMSYIDLCRIFASPKIIKEFAEIRDHEEDLWATVQSGNLYGTRFKDIARIFLLSDDMRMTRTSVASTRNYSFAFWNYQRFFQAVTEYNDSNTAILGVFRNKRKNSLNTLIYGNARPNIVLYNLSFNEVKDELLDKYIFPPESKLNKHLIDKIQSQLQRKDINAVIDVVWIRDGIPAKHPVIDGRIGNYMSGRRPQDINKPVIYPGDHNILVKKDTMQLQIHHIQDKDSEECSYALALYVPTDYVAQITNLVIRD